jgi:LacI family transcriptional regulator
VSIATVSRVLSENPSVRAETRDRVLAAAEELGWRPSSLARSLAGEPSGVVGLVFPELIGHYAAQVVLGFEERAIAADGSVYVLATHGRARSGELVRDLAARTDGLVIMDRTVDDALVEELSERGTRIVLFARPPVGPVPSVRAENRRASEELASHLIGHGHRRLAFVGDPDAAPDLAERWAGFRAAHAAAGLAPPESPQRCGFTQDDGYRAASQVLDREPRPTAVVCATDELALGVYWLAGDRGLQLPADLAVTGWDDLAASRALNPPLTTVHQPIKRLGERAADLLYGLIDGQPVGSEVLPSALVIRGSCGCRPADQRTRENA